MTSLPGESLRMRSVSIAGTEVGSLKVPTPFGHRDFGPAGGGSSI